MRQIISQKLGKCVGTLNDLFRSSGQDLVATGEIQDNSAIVTIRGTRPPTSFSDTYLDAVRTAADAVTAVGRCAQSVATITLGF